MWGYDSLITKYSRLILISPSIIGRRSAQIFCVCEGGGDRLSIVHTYLLPAINTSSYQHPTTRLSSGKSRKIPNLLQHHLALTFRYMFHYLFSCRLVLSSGFWFFYCPHFTYRRMLEVDLYQYRVEVCILVLSVNQYLRCCCYHPSICIYV